MLNRICFTICILCIVAGSVLGLLMIWGDFQDNDVIWKSGLSVLVFFLASLMAMVVSNSMGKGARDSP